MISECLVKGIPVFRYKTIKEYPYEERTDVIDITEPKQFSRYFGASHVLAEL